jgi:flagellar hook-basal body complex protein FliE
MAMAEMLGALAASRLALGLAATGMAAPGMAASGMAATGMGAIRAPELFDLGVAGKDGAGFGAALSDAVSRVEDYRVQSENSIQQFLAGEDEDVHAVAVSVQKAEASFELFLQLRNKVVEAYQEIMRMQL